MRHIYIFTYLNTTNETDNEKQLIKVYNRISGNMENRDIHKHKIEENWKIEDITIHMIPNRDPLFSVLEYSNGNKT